MKRLIILLIQILLIVGNINAQRYYFENYSVREGLAQSKVYDVLQAKDGSLWLGTASGVSKFNGNDFINFSSDDGMAKNGVRNIFQDSKGILWFGHTGGGISYYNGIVFKQLYLDSLKITGDITGFLEDSKGRLWIASQGSGAVLIENFQNFQAEPVNVKQFTGKTKLGDRVFFITETRDSTIYFIIDNLIKTYDESKQTFKTYRHEGLSFYFQPTTLFEDRDKNLWYGTYRGGLYRQDYKTGNVTIFDQKRDGLANNWVSCISQDLDGNIWVGTWGGGITRIDPNFFTFNQANGLMDNKIWKIITDREGNVLIGTNENGLCIFKGGHFVSFQSEDGLLSEQVNAVSEDNQNNIWIGTLKGLCKYNLSGKSIKQVSLGQNNINSEIISVKKDLSGNIWIATKTDGIYSYNPLKNKISYNSGFNAMIIRYGQILTCMEVDRDGHIWIGTIDGLFYLEPEKNTYQRLMGYDISCLYFDTKNVMWVGTRGRGIHTINNIDLNTIDALSKVNALAITEDLQNNIWIGTEGQGVMVYTTDSAIIRYKKKDGLLADYASALTTDKEGNIWIGTNKGLNKYDVENEKFFSYTERNGFTGIEVKQQALFTDFNGNIYCGTVNGLFKFDPKKRKN